MFHSPSFNDPEFETVDTLSYLLGDGNSSRFKRALVYEQQVAAEVSVFTWPTESVGMFFAVATARPGVDAEHLETSMRLVLDDLKQDGLTPEELEGAQNRARRSLVGQLSRFGDRADFLAHAAVLRDDPHYLNDAFSHYSLVDAAMVEEIAESVVDEDRLTVLHVVPEETS